MQPQRIVIVGCSGSGKSTLARKLGLRLGLPVVHLDVLHYLPEWKRASLADFRARITEAHRGEAWISEGNFASWTFDIRLPRAEAFIVLDRPRWLCLWRSFGAPPWSGATDLICHSAAPSKLIETYSSISGISERLDGARSRWRDSTTALQFRCSGSVVIAKSLLFYRRRNSRRRRQARRRPRAKTSLSQSCSAKPLILCAACPRPIRMRSVTVTHYQFPYLSQCHSFSEPDVMTSQLYPAAPHRRAAARISG